METLTPILYYSIFNHPLKKDEIFKYSSTDDLKKVTDQLSELIEDDIIAQSDEYFYFGNVSQIQKRINGELAASKVKDKAMNRAKLIYRFPYIEGVAFSGSFSKNYFDELSDIDFFIHNSTQ